jgi:hypothetical protein
MPFPWMAALGAAQMAGSLGGMFFKDNPGQNMANNYNALNSQFSPQTMGMDWMKWQELMKNSPMYRNSLMNIFAQSARNNNYMTPTSGINAMRNNNPYGQNAQAVSGLNSQFSAQALNALMQSRQMQAQLAGGAGQPRYDSASQYGAMLQTLGQMGTFFGPKKTTAGQTSMGLNPQGGLGFDRNYLGSGYGQPQRRYP